MNYYGKRVVVASIVFFIIWILGWMAHLSSRNRSYIEVSILDLCTTTWDVSSDRVVGAYKGEIIRENQFEVGVYYGEPEGRLSLIDVVLCNRFDNWMIKVGPEGLHGCDRGEYYDLGFFYGVLKILNEEGGVLVTIK